MKRKTHRKAKIGTFGIEKAWTEILEICDLDKRVKEITKKEISLKMEEAREMFMIAKGSVVDKIIREPSKEDLLWSARVVCGLDKLVEDFALDGLTYYYPGKDGISSITLSHTD